MHRLGMSPQPLSTAPCAFVTLYFHTLTNCFFHKSCLLIFIRIAPGVGGVKANARRNRLPEAPISMRYDGSWYNGHERGVVGIWGGGMAAKQKRSKRKLSAVDFCGDGEPYSEVVVTISIRVLGPGITRSRLAVNVFPDPALEKMARESLEEQEVENCGFNEHGVFGACLLKSLSGWADMNEDYPRVDENLEDSYRSESAKDMNAYIAKSVEWALTLNKRGMAEAAKNDGAPPRGKDLVM
jgi:hypothetical protein